MRSRNIFNTIVGIVAPLLTLNSNSALAIGNFQPSEAELRVLPEYCVPRAMYWGNDTSRPEVAVWASRFGEAWQHMHHYCDVHLHIYRANRSIGDKTKYRFSLQVAMDNLDYMLERLGPTFPLIAEMTSKKGEILEMMGQRNDAIQWHQKAVEYNQGYAKAYCALVDLYLDGKDKSAAEQWLSKGLSQAPKAKCLSNRAKNLGVTLLPPVDSLPTVPSQPQTEPVSQPTTASP